MEKIVPENLFDLTPFQFICRAKNFVSLTNINIELFITRHNVIIHAADDKGGDYPFDVKFSGELEYCGKEDDFKIFKIPFGAQKNELIFFVGKDNVISKLAITADTTNRDSLNSSAGIMPAILPNLGFNFDELLDVNEMIQNHEMNIFHWCAETERFVFINAEIKKGIWYTGFFAAV